MTSLGFCRDGGRGRPSLATPRPQDEGAAYWQLRHISALQAFLLQGSAAALYAEGGDLSMQHQRLWLPGN
eukprot:CAMPEP_0117649794 /NCGR_PEP_ID=MMETSP0804-20121206/1185_1 /TAXON_ID=1074897 /ORGANISM="Tetraselmis astigmatica, Strain CCMP880" /LENGTH=69 /DNA_ID=CAMNT_0005455601 /DNA_START=179 /DNA_END=388 /DNA_ORIENTATION=+